MTPCVLSRLHHRIITSPSYSGSTIIEHGRRKILHFNVTRHPTAEWVLQQLPKAFPKLARSVTSF